MLSVIAHCTFWDHSHNFFSVSLLPTSISLQLLQKPENPNLPSPGVTVKGPKEVCLAEARRPQNLRV